MVQGRFCNRMKISYIDKNYRKVHCKDWSCLILKFFVCFVCFLFLFLFCFVLFFYTFLPFLNGYSEILWAELHFSPHILILFFIFRRNSPILASLQQDFCRNRSPGFVKIGRSLHFVFISDAGASTIRVQFSMEKYNS